MANEEVCEWLVLSPIVCRNSRSVVWNRSHDRQREETRNHWWNIVKTAHVQCSQSCVSGDEQKESYEVFYLILPLKCVSMSYIVFQVLEYSRYTHHLFSTFNVMR